MNIKNNKGFSLIEVLVTVGLVGLLVGIAVPQYGKYKARTGIVALKADMGNAQKSYAAYDAIQNTLCADWTTVGLANSANETIFTQSQLYRKQAYIGFTNTETDCPLDSNAVLNHQTQIDSTATNTESGCTQYGGTWDSSDSLCGSLPTTINFAGTTDKCILGTNAFILGATTGVANIGNNQTTGFSITHGGLVAESATGDICDP